MKIIIDTDEICILDDADTVLFSIEAEPVREAYINQEECDDFEKFFEDFIKEAYRAHLAAL